MPGDAASELTGLEPRDLLRRGLEPQPGTGVWEPPTPEEMAQSLPQYRIDRLLGRGGMGAVYKGTQVRLERPVAIKILPAHIGDDETFFARFQREARILAMLRHPGIVRVYDFGQTSDGRLYFVMEFVDGADLREVMEGAGLEASHALRLTSEICDALQCAHEAGVVHRDIKPANILITRDGHAKLADFGIALPSYGESISLTMSHVVVGSGPYIAPEQRTGECDSRADIFALGVTLYEMLTGRPPLGAFLPASRKVEVDQRIDRVVHKALQADSGRRYQSIGELKADVEQIRLGSAELGIPAPGPAEPDPRRHRRRLVGIGSLLLLFLAVAWLELAHHHSSPGASANAFAKPLESGALSGDPFTATKLRPFVNSLGMEFVPVPISDGPTDTVRSGITVLFATTITTVAEYERFVSATNHERLKPSFEQSADHAAVNLSRDDAQAFCDWLTAGEHQTGALPYTAKYRLPSDHEWSCAVAMGKMEDANDSPKEKDCKIQLYPWGSAWPPPKGAGNFNESVSHDGYEHTSPVKAFSPNTFGLYDMGGNAWQWCMDSYGPGDDAQFGVMRGASWSVYKEESTRLSCRNSRARNVRTDGGGFRCILESAPSSRPSAKAAPEAQDTEQPAREAKRSPSDWMHSPENEKNFGGWTTVGNALIETGNGMIRIGTSGGLSGIVCGKRDFTRFELRVEAAGSPAVQAWVGVRVAAEAGQWHGYTSYIKGIDGFVNAGHGGRNFATASKDENRTEYEGGLGKAKLPPGQFFTFDFQLNEQGALWTKVNGKTTSGVSRNVPAAGCIGIFVSAGTLTVKKIEITNGAQSTETNVPNRPANLDEALAMDKWEWSDPPYPKSQVRFKSDGGIQFDWRWSKTGPSTVHVQFHPSAGVDLVFGQTYDGFDGSFTDEHGHKHVIHGTRLPRSAS